MNNPPVSELLKKVDSKYTLIAVAAKRARQYIDRYDPESEERPKGNPVTIALREIAADKVYWERLKDGIK